MPSDTDIAWAAGFFDGEGSISVPVMRGRVHFIRLSISQNRLEPLRQLQSWFGGFINPHSSDGIWTWTLSSKGSRLFLSAVRPYLRVKYAQADLALSFPLGMSGKPLTNELISHRESIRTAVMEENSRRDYARS